VTVASLNIRGVPLTGSRLAARCQAIGAFFEASDVDVACFQEVHIYGHLALLARQMRSFRYMSFRRPLPGPAGDVVTFSRLPVSGTTFQGFGAVGADIPRLARLRARLKGALVTRLSRPGVSLVNTHPVANTDGDWSPANQFVPACPRARSRRALRIRALRGALAGMMVLVACLSPAYRVVLGR